MGDMSEMRPLIVLFTLISVIISLIILIPSNFYTSNLTNTAAPDVSDVNAIIAWNSTLPVNMTSYNPAGYAEYTFELNGYNFLLMTISSDENYIFIMTYAQWWVFVWDQQPFDWYHSGSLVSEPLPIIISPYNIGPNAAVIATETIDSYDTPQEFKLKNDHAQFSVTCVYNTTAYDSFDEAVENSEASIVFNVDWDDRDTSMNALQLVGMILTGALPNIHPVLSLIFSFIGWSLVAAGAYLIFIFALRIAGAIFGGGGS